MIIKHPPNYFQGSIAGLESSLLLQSEEKKNLDSSSKSLSDPQKSLKKLEQLSWNVDRTGEIGKWDIARATNFQVDPEKHPYLNAALRGVNNTTGFVACIENMATNSAGTILFDLPAAIEDLSVEHGGPSFQELAVSMQGATPGVPDELVPYAFSKLSQIAKRTEAVQKIISIDLKLSESWGNVKSLERHFINHGEDFSAINSQDYAQKASRFFQESLKKKIEIKIDETGIVRIYDVKNNIFGSYNSNGSVRTFFKPQPYSIDNLRGHPYKTNLEYWNAQPGKEIK